MWKLTIEDDQANRTVVPLARDEYSIGLAGKILAILLECVGGGAGRSG